LRHFRRPKSKNGGPSSRPPGSSQTKKARTSGSGPSVWTGRALQAESDDLEVIGLALLYPALERNVGVPGHHGYPRALNLIRVSASKAIRAT
jgi:hypothetical protein